MKLKLIILVTILYGSMIACTNESKENVSNNIIKNTDTVFQFTYPNDEQSIEDSLSHYFGLSTISSLKGDSLIRFFVYGDSAYLIIDLDKKNCQARVIRFLADINNDIGLIKIKKIEDRFVNKSKVWWESLDSVLLHRNIYGLKGQYSTLSTGGYSVCIQQHFLNTYYSSVIDNPEFYLYLNSNDFIDKDDIIKKNVALIMDFLFKELSIKSKMFESLR
ncbi:hypothetical protein [Polluticaenibacter yanchengensis]|uniref:Lipoprotein n=1 Tax=Polluticaenibacter yanchengensis TaxID=3014562 RepID=A0ABT4UPU9_9BACT|nr:hypothetical protein [Chitinophagaceae bacterium LY-5]